MLVKESLKLHSAEQLEIKQEIEIDPEVSKSRYSVESYFFFPAALYINLSFATVLTNNAQRNSKNL